MGSKEIVLTHKDGLLVYADGKSHEMNFYPARLDGRSGRGDTCVGTYVARRLSLEPREAGIWAAAVTSLKMENLGPFNRSIEEVEAFIHANYNHGSVR
jgi:sugar/nucleoside kinase (ribokinase family)